MNDSKSLDLNASLSSLAMLSLRMKEGKDYLDYLHGMVIHTLKKMGGETVDAAKLQKNVQEEFGLLIPSATFAIYLKRLSKSGVLSPVIGGLQYKVKALPQTTIASDRDYAKKRIDEVTEELAAFAFKKALRGF